MTLHAKRGLKNFTVNREIYFTVTGREFQISRREFKISRRVHSCLKKIHAGREKWNTVRSNHAVKYRGEVPSRRYFSRCEFNASHEMDARENY